MDNLFISPAVRQKLAEKHNVTEDEVEECFLNRQDAFVEDTREEHRTDPPTQWFIAETDRGRELKVVFIQRGEMIHLRSCFEPSEATKQDYQRRLHRG